VGERQPDPEANRPTPQRPAERSISVALAVARKLAVLAWHPLTRGQTEPAAAAQFSES
jgi:hypothetical protein